MQNNIGPSDQITQGYPTLEPQGKQFVPPPDVVPKRIIMNKIQQGILKKLNESSAQYDGNMNSQGLFHGRGKIIYMDGSYYDGEWYDGKRQGFGVERFKDGSYYEGYFQNDLKHGEGLLYYSNGTTIETVWENNKMNGKAVIKFQDGQHKEAQFCNDLEIVLDEQNTNCFDMFIVDIIFIILILAFYYMVPYERRYSDAVGDYIAMVVFYIFLVVIGFSSQTTKYLSRQIPVDDILPNINKFKGQHSLIQLKVQHFYYHKNSKKYEQPILRDFIYAEWSDISPDANDISYIHNYDLVRLDYKVTHELNPQSQQSFDFQVHSFKQEVVRHQNHDFSSVDMIQDLQIENLVYNPRNKCKRLFFNQVVNTILIFIGLHWIYRILFIMSTTRVTYTFKRNILK